MDRAGEISQAVGQLLVGRLPGTTVDAQSQAAIRGGIMGGVTLFKDNAADLDQLCALVDELGNLLGEEGLIAVDQEGGAVQRFDNILTPLPSAMAFGALNDRNVLAALIEISARQLRLLGVNCVLAPVLDVASNPLNPIIATRSFGGDPERVAQLGALTAQTYLEGGILPVGKHFPGHGDTLEDSHSNLAVCPWQLSQLASRELLPFERCLSQLPAILTGHIWLPSIDEKPLPASLSSGVTTDLLRQQMGFSGLVITDDLPVMKAIVDHFGLSQAALLAILAGADLLLVSGTLDETASVHDALCAAVQDGQISQERLHQSLSRRRSFLARTAKFTRLNPSPTAARRKSLKESIATSAEISFQSSVAAIAVLRGNLPNIQAHSGDWVIVVPEHPRFAIDLHCQLTRRLSCWTGSLSQKRYPLDPRKETTSEIAAFCAGKHCLFLTYRALINRGQLELGQTLSRNAKSGTLIALDAPFELGSMLEWENAVATFDPSDQAVAALAQLLTGSGAARGVCPVSLPPGAQL